MTAAVLILTLLGTMVTLPGTASAAWHSNSDQLPGYSTGQMLAIAAGLVAAAFVVVLLLRKAPHHKHVVPPPQAAPDTTGSSSLTPNGLETLPLGNAGDLSAARGMARLEEAPVLELQPAVGASERTLLVGVWVRN